MGVHMMLSIGAACALVARRLELRMAVMGGAGVGLGLYVVNFYGFSAIFPGFAMARNTISII